jgi:molybdate transport system regulatory protein
MLRVHASVAFEGRHSVAGRDRIRLLEAVGREGSISGAARAVGLSYKAAWDAIDALNALFGQPLVAARSGGQRGGGAQLTPSGLRVVEALTRLEGELTRALLRLEPGLRGSGITLSNLAPGFMLRTSARNALHGVVTGIKTDAVSARVAIAISPQATIRSIITRQSADELGLCPGRDVVALIKASLIQVASGHGVRPARGGNRIGGTLVRKEIGAQETELIVDVGSRARLVATVKTPQVKAMRLKNRDPLWATFDPRHVILAVG